MKETLPPTAGVQRAEPRLRATLDSLIEGCQIIDRDWRYLYVNPAAARHGHQAVDDLVGRTMMEAYPGIETTALFRVLRRCMEERRTAKLENEFAGADGARWFQLVVEPVPEGIFILSLDITSRKEAEAALRAGQEQFEVIFENLQEGLIVSDLQGELLRWNRAAAAMHGFSSAEEAQSSLNDIAPRFALTTLDGEPVPPGDWPLPRLLRGEEFLDWEVRVRRGADGGERVFAYTGRVAPYHSTGGLALLTIRDVTDRTRAQEELRESERRFIRAQRLESIGTLASGIAHDLNNVLMPIMMGVTLLRRLSTDERSLATIANIERASRRGSDLVNQILLFARGVDETRKPVHVESLVAETTSMLRSTLPKNITLTVVVAPDVHEIEADPTQVHQVLLNLCVNARDAMPQGGRMTITAKNTRVPAPRGTEETELVLLEVRDTGTGIPKELLERIFEPFFTTKGTGKGSGLGLPTSQSIVRSHGGWIHVESDPGKGTLFQVFLPRARAMASTASPVADADEIPIGNGEVILFVDDETSILSVARQTLEAFGYRVLTAENGAQALELFKQHAPEIALVVTDMMMPDIDGARLIAALRDLDSDLPIIATSGESEAGWIERAKGAGARSVLTKPYSAIAVFRMIANLVPARAQGGDAGIGPS